MADLQAEVQAAADQMVAAGTETGLQIAVHRYGRVVADVVRMDKGHTEGLEPKVTEELVKMIVAAPGGKVAGGS